MTVAHEIKSPIKRKSKVFKDGYRDTLVTIWHVDPESDGSDDSCGWFSPKLTKKEIETIKKEMTYEIKFLFDVDENNGQLIPKYPPQAIVYFVFKAVAWRLFKKRITNKHLLEIYDVTLNPFDNFSDLYNGKYPVKADDFIRQCYFIARCFKRIERPWWKHPRWHLHHWRINISIVSQVWRYLFDRCDICKKGFKWNESPMGSWSGATIWHFRCDKNSSGVECASEVRK